jgi:superfamily II DNA or RNA helicase
MNKFKTILTKDGYLIQKKYCDLNTLNTIRNNLTVEPYKFNVAFSKKTDDVDESFQVFRETEDYLIVPKFYGIDNFGTPNKNKEINGESINVQFKGSLRKEQQDLIDSILPTLKEKNGGVICLKCGGGKCLAKDTKILMFNGFIKTVQNIKVGDVIMGDDSTPRNVLSVCHDREIMYKIYDEQNNSYIVNESHILSLKDPSLNTIDIPLLDFIKLPNQNEYFGYRVPITFPEQELDIDPYLFGFELVRAFIPHEYKCNSRKNQLALLAGIIDSKGECKNNIYSIYTTNKILTSDIIFLVRSLGFIVSINQFTINIYGNNLSDIPTKYNITPDNNIYPLHYKIKIEKLDVDDYYGFEIDGNHRFVLGDFTVTHNTVIGLYLATLFKVKTLIIVHKSFLLNQWKERIEQFTNAKIGIIQQNTVDIDGKDIVIGMLQSIAKEKYDADIFRDFGMVIFDEAHHAPSRYFSRALPLINTKITLALSATPNRSDKLEKVLFWYFGPMLYKFDYEKNNTVLSKIYKYTIEHEKFVEKKMRFTSDVNRPGTISNIITIGRRNRFIIDLVENLIAEERKIIVLSERVEHLELLKKRLDERNLTTSGLYVGGMKQSKLDESAKCQVIFGTFQMASEALDIKGLNTLLMATPRREIEQTVGRITRDPNPKIRPLVIDILDNLDSFVRQGYYRRQFYRKNGYQIIFSDVIDNKIINEQDITTTFDGCENSAKDDVVDFIDD